MNIHLLSCTLLFNAIALNGCQRMPPTKPPQFMKPNLQAMLPRVAYKKMAQRVMANTLALGKGPARHREFCREQMVIVAALNAKWLDVPNALQKLDSGFLSIFLLKLKDKNPDARFQWEFVTTNELLVSLRLRRILGCYHTGDLADFEQEYSHELEQVKAEEYQKRLTLVPTEKGQHIIIEESGRLADAILQLPKE